MLGLAVNLLLPQISDLTRSWEVLRTMTWWAVGLAFVAEILSYYSYGYCLHAIVNLHEKKLSAPGTLIVMAATTRFGSRGLVCCGRFHIGSVGAKPRQHHRDHGTYLPSMLLNLSIEVIAILGIVYLAVIGKLTNSHLSVHHLPDPLTISTFDISALVLPKQTYRIVNTSFGAGTRIAKPYNPQKTMK